MCFPQLTKFIFSSKFILQILSLDIFHKKLLNICHANCSLIVSSFAIPLRLLAVPTVLYQMKFVWNFVFEKLLVVQHFYKNIHTLRKKMFCQNPGHVLFFCLIFVWVKLHVIIIRFTWDEELARVECSSKHYQTCFLVTTFK